MKKRVGLNLIFLVLIISIVLISAQGVGEIDMVEDFRERNFYRLGLPDEFDGYIIEFEDEPIIVKNTELRKEAERNQEIIRVSPPPSPRGIYTRMFGIGPHEVDEETKEYGEELGFKNWSRRK